MCFAVDLSYEDGSIHSFPRFSFSVAFKVSYKGHGQDCS